MMALGLLQFLEKQGLCHIEVSCCGDLSPYVSGDQEADVIGQLGAPVDHRAHQMLLNRGHRLISDTLQLSAETFEPKHLTGWAHRFSRAVRVEHHDVTPTQR